VQFKRALPKIEDQKNFVTLLRRYTKLYYFIAQFFELPAHLGSFIVFSEVMSDLLIKKGKTSELKKVLKNIDLSKGAVKYQGLKTNLLVVKDPEKTNAQVSSSGRQPPTDRPFYGQQSHYNFVNHRFANSLPGSASSSILMSGDNLN
jgi:type I restriction enzyme R subunit